MTCNLLSCRLEVHKQVPGILHSCRINSVLLCTPYTCRTCLPRCVERPGFLVCKNARTWQAQYWITACHCMQRFHSYDFMSNMLMLLSALKKFTLQHFLKPSSFHPCHVAYIIPDTRITLISPVHILKFVQKRVIKPEKKHSRS